uniref:transporter substrate-binding domain-containing protein n=1 Tax=Castellaniella defragrans TaxID=75697 RepID=UPI00333F5862
MNRGRMVFNRFQGTLTLCAGLALASPAAVWATEVVGMAQVPADAAPGAKARTPARIEVLAAREAVRPDGRLVAVDDPTRLSAMIADGELEAWVGVIPEGADLEAGVRLTSLKYPVSPMAIMRTDTDIHDWQALSGRTVCLAADGRYVGELAARYGAIEQVYPSTADALLGMRTGQCDAMVHDQAFLQELLALPEWKKFSAQLKPYRQVDLVQVTKVDPPRPRALYALLVATSPRRLTALTIGQVRETAFEVYLDQTVPDCH